MSDISPDQPQTQETVDPELARRFTEEVRDAIELLDFAVSQGCRISDALILRIKKAQNFLAEGASWPKDEDRADFEAAYRDLAQFMQPITAATLRATQDKEGKNWWLRFWRASPAKWFSRRLYCLVLLCAAGIVADQTNLTPKALGTVSAYQSILTSIMPFLYGLLGALVYLLKSANSYIADRTFDLYHVPEYYNRMVLGLVSGGVILIFRMQTDVPQNVIAFLVGYNTDYLFQTIERVANAIFPKVGKPDRHTPAPGVAKVDIPNPSVKAGASGNGAVVLTGAAPTGGVPVALTAPAGITFAASSVSVNQGSTTANFTFTVAKDVAAGTHLNIIATANGTTASGTITVPE